MPKKQPPTPSEPPRTTVRRIQDITHWFEPTENLKSSNRGFRRGVLSDVTLDPNATIMKDVFCGTDRISEATATGVLDIGTDTMPPDAITTRPVGYCTKRKVFHTKENPEEVFDRCDYLVLHHDGSSTAGWKTAEIPAPAGS
jgi:hypothetical protein